MTEIFIEEFKNVDYQLTAIDTDVQSRQLYPTISSISTNPGYDIAQMIKAIGINGSTTEQAFLNIHNFMNSQRGKKFFREKSAKEIIILTDEEEQSPQTVEEMKTLFEGKLVTVNTLLPVGQTSCSSIQRKNEKLEELTAQTGGLIMDICSLEQDFRTDYRDLARKMAERATAGFGPKLPISEYQLHDDLIVDSIVVKYGSQVIPRGLINTGWTYHTGTHMIHFGSDIKLSQQPADSKLVIEYQLN